jgi:membrane protein implicated in regulation of membrane protease activity
MTWSDIFLGCLVFGFMLSAIPVLAGSMHLHFHGFGHHSGAHGKLSFGTVAAFIMWFGGAGYILTKFESVGLWIVIPAALAAGCAGAAIIVVFIAKVVAPGDIPLDPADYRMVGSLGTVSSAVRPNGTGEMIFVQQGRRSGVAIRSEGGDPIAVGKEVVVTRYEGGIAYVREWDELTGERL